LTPPLPDQAAAITYDPLRTRMFFLAVLPAQQRRTFLDDCAAGLRRQIEILRAECERYRQAGDEFSRLAMRGALHVVRGRLTWIREVRRNLPLN
jgi:hypothetical protein